MFATAGSKTVASPEMWSRKYPSRVQYVGGMPSSLCRLTLEGVIGKNKAKCGEKNMYFSIAAWQFDVPLKQHNSK